MAGFMKVETLMWLLPAVFMIHDFEEIIMFESWIKKAAPNLRSRFPRPAKRMLPHMEKLSTASFSVAVAEEFVLLILVTLISVEFDQYSLWTGVLSVFFIHLIVHIIQSLVYRGYVPSIITSVFGSAYCLLALSSMASEGMLNWLYVTLWTVIAVVVAGANLVFAHKLAACFQSYILDRHAGQKGGASQSKF